MRTSRASLPRPLCCSLSRFSSATAISAALMLAAAVEADAQNITWDASSAVNFNWDDIRNWSGDLAEPVATNDVIFPSPIPNPGSLANPATITLTAGELANSLTFNAAYTLTGGTLTLSTGNPNSGNVTVAAATVATINSTLGGTSGFTKLGTGTLSLGADNLASLSGAVALNQGRVTITNLNALGAGTATVGAAGTLELNAPASGNLGSSVVLNGGTLVHTPGTQVTLQGTANLSVSAAGGTVDVVTAGPGGKLFVNGGNISGPTGATLNKVGAGTLQLAGANAALLSNVNVTGGQLELQNSTALGGAGGGSIAVGGAGEVVTSGVPIANGVTVNTGGTLSSDNSGGGDFQGAVNVAGNGNIALRYFYSTGTPNNLKISGTMSGAGNLNVTAPAATSTAVSSLLLTGNNTAYTGTITIAPNAQVRALQGTGVDALGGAPIALSGGTLGISPVITAAGATPGFQGRYYIGSAANTTASITSGVIGGYDFGLTPTPGATRTDTTINFSDFTLAAQRPAGFNPASNSNFGILWTGLLNITTPGAYTFNTASDDGSLLYVDGQPVVLNDFAQGTTTRSGAISLPAGLHSLIVKYGQGGGGTNMFANYNGPDTGGVDALIGSVAGTLTNNGAIIQGTSTIDNNITLAPGTTSAIDLAATTATNTGTLTFGNGARLNVTGLTGSESLTQQGNVTLNGANVLAAGNIQVPGNLQNQSAGADVIISGVIGQGTAGSSLTKVGPQDLTLSNTNTYTGGTNYSGGNLLTLNAPGGNAIPGDLTLSAHGISTLVLTAREFASNQIADNANVTLVGFSGIAGSNLDLNGFNDTIGSLTFINNQGSGIESVTTGAGTLTVNGPVNFAGSSTGVSVISGNLNLGGANRVFTANGLGSLNVSAVVSNGSITKAGLGTVTLSGANAAYNGVTTVNNGKLSIGNAGALGTTAAAENTVVNAGGVLDIVNVATAEPITINGRGQPNLANIGVNSFGLNYTGALQGSGGFLGVASGPITLGSDASVGAVAGSLLTISGVISGPFSLTKTQGNNAALIGTAATAGGPGIVKLTGINTYTGPTIVEAGDLWLAGTGQTLASTSVVIGTGTSDAALTAVTTNNQFAPGTILTFSGGSKNAKLQLNGTTQTIAGFNVSGSLPIIQNHESAAPGPGTLIVNNPLDTSFNGIIRDQSNTLALTKQGAGTLTLSGNGPQFGLAPSTAGIIYTGATNVSGGKLLVSDATAFNAPITLSGTGSLEFNYSYGRALALSKVVTDGGLGFTKSGAGDLTLTGANVVTGPVQVTGGSLVIGGAIGASTVLPGAPINVAPGAQLDLFGAAGATSYNNNVTLNGLTFGGALAGAVSGGVIDNTLSGTITLNATSNVSTGWADKTFRMTGQITGPGGLQFDKLLFAQQPGVFQVTNATNNYSGGTTINAGTVYFASAALPSTGLLTFGGAFTQSSLATLNAPNLVLGTNGLTGPFTRTVGTGSGEVAFTGEGGGFSAIGGTQTVTFGGATPQTVNWGGPGFSANAGLWFNGSNALGGGSTFNADSEVNVTNDFVLSGGGLRRIFVVDNNGSATDQVRFSGALSGPGGILKDGGNSAGGANLQGTLIFSGATPNTYTGLTNVSAGVLRLNKTAGVNAIAGDLQIGGVQNNGTRRIVYLGANDQIADTSTVTLIGSNANNGDLRLFGFNETVAAIQDRSGGGVIEVTDQAEVALGTGLSTLTVSGNGDSFFNGFFRNAGGTGTGTLALTKAGTGTLTISAGQQSGSGSQNYTGATAINAGKLVYANLTAFGSAPTIAAGATLEFAENINQSGTDAQIIAGAGNVVKSGLGTIVLGGANSYSGSTTINGGTLQITAATDAAQTGAYVVNSGGTLLIGNGSTAGALTNNNNITINAGGTVAFSRNNAYAYSGILSGAGSVEGRTGGGVITLGGANTYTGSTTVNGGTIVLGGNGASGGGLTVNSGGTLSIDFGQAGSAQNNVVAPTAAVTLRGGTLNVLGKAATTDAQTLGNVTVDVGASTLATTEGAGGTMNLSLGTVTHNVGGVLSIGFPTAGSGTISTTSPGIGGILGGFATTGGNTWVADNAGLLSPLATYGADTYGAAVNTNVVAGGAGSTTNSMRFNTAAANTVTFTGINTINSGGILETAAVGANASTITGGTLRGPTGGDLVVIQNNNAGNLTIASTIADNGSATGLTKAGTGTLILSGANSYSGNTFVTQGTLIDTSSLGTGAVSVNSGATLQVGDGVTNGSVAAFGVNRGTVLINNATAQTISTLFNVDPTFNFTNNAVANPTTFQTGTLSKIGAGTLTITSAMATNQFHQRAGTTVLDSGADVRVNGFNSIGLAPGDVASLTVKGNGRIIETGDFNVGDQTGSTGTLNVQDQAVVSVGRGFIGKTGTAIGVVNQSGGTVSGMTQDFRIGGDGASTAANPNAYGIYNISAGALNTTVGSNQRLNIGTGGTGVLNQTGGTITVGDFAAVGRYQGDIGLLNINNGVFNANGSRLVAGDNSTGTINLSGTGQIFATGGISLGGGGGGNGVFNLGVGGLANTAIVNDQDGSATTPSNFAFHGGKLQARAAAATFMQGLNSAIVYSEGALIDTNTFAVTINQPLLAPTGNGITAIPVLTGGSGYLGEPVVQITGGGGTGATARAILTGGVITGFTITNPGVDYTSAPTITLLGGGAATPGTAAIATFGANTTTGGLTKIGTGTLTLNNSETYGGPTTITGGILQLDYNAATAPASGANMLPATGALVINGGGLLVSGKAAATPVTSQTFSGLTLNSTGTITGTIGTGGTVNIVLNGITRNAGSAVNFTLPATGAISTSTANTGTSILGGWATVAGANWAVSAGDGTNNGAITPLAAAGYTANTWAAGNNTDMTTAGTVTNLATNSVRFNTATPVTVTISGTDVITTGGVLITPTATAAATIFTGGTLNTADAATDLVVNHFGTNNATIVSAIGVATGGLVKAGPGVLILSSPANTNLYVGNTVVGAGTLRLGVANQIPDGAGKGDVIVHAGATFDMNGLSDSINGLSGFGTIANGGTLTLGGNNASSTFSGAINNGTALTKVGTGTLTLDNVVAGNFTGATTISAGAIKLVTPNALSNNTTINVNAAGGLLFDTTIPLISGLGGNATFALQTTATSPVANAPVQLTVGNNNANGNYSGALTGPGTLIKTGGGIQTLSGANTLTGGVAVNAGLLELSGNNSGATGPVIVNSGGALQIKTSNSFFGATGRNLVVGNGGAVTFGSVTANPASVGFGPVGPGLNRIDPLSTGSLSLQVDGSLQTPVTENLNFSAAGPGGALNLSLGALLTGAAGTGNTPVQYTGIITPNGNTFRLGGGNGRLILSNGATLSGANSLNIGGGGNFGQLFLTADFGFTGSTIINAGTTIVRNLPNGGQDSPLGASSSAASNLVLNGGTLQYVGDGGSTDRLFTLSTTPTAIDSSGSAPITFVNPGAVAFLNSGNRTLTLQGTNTGVNLLGAAIGDSVQVPGTSAVLGNGTTALTKNGNGSWGLTGNNTFSGGVTINNGVLGFLTPGSIGANTVNGPASVLVNANGSAAFGPALTGSIQTALNRISPLSTGSVSLTANTSENLNFDGGAGGATLPGAFLGAYGNVNYTGTLTPFGNTYRLGGGGGVLSLPNGGLTGPRVVQLGGGGPGAGFVNNSNLNGAVVLGGVSDYSGGTVLGTGAILSATNLGALGSGPLKFQGGFYRAVDTTDITLASDGTSAREIRIGNETSNNVQTANVDVASGVNVTFSKTFGVGTPVGANQGQQSFTKWGAGTLTLANGVNLTTSNGSNTLATNSGTLTVERGTLSILNNPTNFNGLIQIGSNNGGVGVLKLAANNVFANTTAQFTTASIFDTYNGSKLDLNGFSDTLRLVRGFGSIVNTGAATANLTVGTGNEIGIIGGNLVGNFTLTKGGTVTNLFGTGATINSLELWNSNNAQFTGKFVVNAGGLRIRADGSLGAANEPFKADKITLNNNAVLLSAGGTNVVIGANHGITLGAGGGTLWQFGTAAMVVQSPITGPGALTIADDVGAIFLANDNNNWAGGTTINNNNVANRGLLAIGAGGPTGSLPAGDVLFNSAGASATSARLLFFKSTDTTVPNNFNGPGTIFQIGAGTTTLTGNNSTNQTTVVGGGKLRADFSNPARAPLSNGTALQLSAGTFEYVAPAGDNTLRLGSLTNTAFSGTNGLFAAVMVGGGIGDTTVQSTYGGSGSQTLLFNGIARGTAGVTTNFVTSGGVNGVSNTIRFQSGPALNSAMGGAYYFNGSEFAALDINGFVRPVSPGVDPSASAVNTLGGGQFGKLTTGINGQGAITVSGINLSGATAGLNMAAGAALTLNANPGALLKSGGGTSVINGGAGATVSNNNQELILRADTAGDTLQIDLPLTGTGQLTKSGLGQVTLTAANTATGNNLFSQGTVLLTGNGTLGTAGSPTGEIRIGNAAGQTATLTIDSATAGVTMATGANALRVGEAGTGIVNQSNGTVNVPNFLTIGESLGASGTYNITGGTLNVKTNNGAPPAGQPNMVVGRVGTGTVNIGGNATVNVLNGGQIMLGMGTNNSSGFQGMVPNAALSTGVGTITQTGGTVNVAVGNGTYQSNIFGGVIVGVDGTGTYSLNGGTLNTPFLGRGNGTATFNLGGGTLKAAANTLNVDLPMNLTGTGAGKGTIDTNGNDLTFTSALTGTGGVVKAGAGTLSVLGETNNYTGGTDISGGTVVASGTSLGSGAVNVAAGAALSVQGAQQGLLARFILANKTDVTAGVTNANVAMTPEIASLETFNAFVAGKAAVAEEPTTARGKISVNYLENGGANGNTALPPALIALNNGSNPFIAHVSGDFNAPTGGEYTFQTRSDDGTVVWIDGQPVLDNNRGQGQTTRTGTINLSAGPHDMVIGYYQGTGGGGFSVGVTLPGQGQSFTIGSELNMPNSLLSHGSNTLTVGSVGGAGALQVGTSGTNLSAVTLNTGGDNSDTVLSGGIVGSGTLVKQGTGKMTLSGNSNAFAGNTTVNGGTLAVNGILGGQTVTVNGPSTLEGSGTIEAALVQNAGSTLAPGPGPAQLDTGNITLQSGSNFSLQLNGPTAGTGFDQINTTGTVTLNGGNITLTLGYAPSTSDRFAVILNDGTDPVNGTFGGLPEGSFVTRIGGFDFFITYRGNGDGGSVGNDVLISIPEPACLMTLAGGVGMLVGLQRFRRKS